MPPKKSKPTQMHFTLPNAQDPTEEATEEVEANSSESQDEQQPKRARQGRKKIKIEYIPDKSRRHITFSKRRFGIMKKAYELATLTGTQVLLLVAAETGHVYTFATEKLQPIISSEEGMEMIQNCLNAPDPQEEVEPLPSPKLPEASPQPEQAQPVEQQHLIPVYNPTTGETHYLYQHNGQAVLLGLQPVQEQEEVPSAKKKRNKKRSRDDDDYEDA